MLQVTDYDKCEVDWKKPHTIVGGGGANDVVLQNGRYHTALGKRIQGPMTKENLAKHGISWSRDIANLVQIEGLKSEELRLRENLQRQIEELEKREKDRILLGLSAPPTFEDKGEIDDPEEDPTPEQQLDAIDMQGLDGLEELEEEAAQPSAPKRVKAKAKTKK
jgi:hypothetical protein